MIPDYDMLVRQGEKQSVAVAELRDITKQLLINGERSLAERLLAVIEIFGGTTQVTMLMTELSKPKDGDAP